MPLKLPGRSPPSFVAFRLTAPLLMRTGIITRHKQNAHISGCSSGLFMEQARQMFLTCHGSGLRCQIDVKLSDTSAYLWERQNSEQSLMWPPWSPRLCKDQFAHSASLQKCRHVAYYQTFIFFLSPSSHLKKDLFYVYEYFTCTYVCVLCTSLMPIEVRRGHVIPWNWYPGTGVSDGCELSNWLVLENEAGSSAITPRAFNHWAISVAPSLWLLNDILDTSLSYVSSYGCRFCCCCCVCVFACIWYACTQICSSVCMHMCACAGGGEKSTQNVFLYFFTPLIFWDRLCYYTWSSPTWLCRLPKEFQPVSISLVVGSQMGAAAPSFWYACWGYKPWSLCSHSKHFTGQAVSPAHQFLNTA
jgi:hypothetical protein